MSSAIVIIVPVVPIIHGTASPGTYRAIVWIVSVSAVLLLVTTAVWGYMGFADWLRRHR